GEKVQQPVHPHTTFLDLKTRRQNENKKPHTQLSIQSEVGGILQHRKKNGTIKRNKTKSHNHSGSHQPQRPGPLLTPRFLGSPLSLFQLFFSPAVVRTIIDNTNINAARRLRAGKKFVWKVLTVRDFYIFMAILFFSSLVSVHHRSDYWRKAWPYNFPFPGNKMARNCFEAILWSLHLSNPEEDEDNERKKNTADYDRLFKIKPLYTEIVTACQAHFQPYQMISIDERMVASKARHRMKQYQKDKPTKWGYKLFVLADSSTGYTWNFFVYTGKSVSTTGQGLSYSSVMDLLPLSSLGYTLFVDNFYTSPTLFQDLSARNIGCCGTIRKNRIGFPQTDKNDLPKKAERGDLRWLRRGNLLFVKWMDTREATMCPTVYAAFSAGVWQSKSIPAPDPVIDYNQNMGGVDLSDALIGYYSVHHKSLKWYKTFFYHFMDIATVNSFILYKELFKLRKEPASTGTPNPKKFKEQLVNTMELMPHSPRSRAGFPRVKTPIYCRKFQVPLCLTSTRNCFREWHDLNTDSYTLMTT
uniref:PiggyBac transposable element-derived protein domain-containing protein n=1 Tax=Kryptolebias marmoratus TaxID=37003 RepID=A0A3Q2ZYM5_KRYMA